MSMPYPDHETYAHLYARYLQGTRTEQLLEAAGPLEGKRVADVCAGGGRLTRLALQQGARVTAVEESALMSKGLPQGAHLQVRSVSDWLREGRPDNAFDAVFCQQAVNYWLDVEMAWRLAASICPGGAFVFNTFNKAPSRVPLLKQYELNGAHFVEASWLSGTDTVQHVQMREGEPPHTTQFKWISREQFVQWLSPWFQLEERIDGAASVWVCTRPAAK